MKTKPKLLLNDTKAGIDEGQQLWYPEPFYFLVKNDDSSGVVIIGCFEFQFTHTFFRHFSDYSCHCHPKINDGN